MLCIRSEWHNICVPAKFNVFSQKLLGHVCDISVLVFHRKGLRVGTAVDKGDRVDIAVSGGVVLDGIAHTDVVCNPAGEACS